MNEPECMTEFDVFAFGNAPSNATSWYKNPCVQSALAKGAASTVLDAVGLLPEGGAVSAAFSLWHGAAGVSNGTKILERVQFGAGLISTANAGSDVSGVSWTGVSWTDVQCVGGRFSRTYNQ